ncbi:hypothetical protein MTP99_010057 [Tenebrio molitor]|nr:hypothetical protein MTP99_010057 [Tenebrio molitor]
MSGNFVFAVISGSLGSGFAHGFHAGLLNILSGVINDWYDNLDDEDPFENNDDYNDRGDIVYPNYYDDDHEEPHNPLDITGTKLLLVAVFGLGGILGSLLIAIFAGLFGRKGSLLCSNAISLLGLLLMSFARVAYSFELFIIGRLLLGISAGLHSGLSPMYLIEIAPECLRGIVGSAYYASVALAVVAAYIFTLPSVMGSKGLWPFLFLFAFFPPIIQSVMLVFCPESPKYLYMNKEDEDAAEDSLATLRGDDIDDEMEELREEGNILQEIGPVTFARLFNDQTLRSPLIICTVIMFGQQACGIDVIIIFSTVLIEGFEYTHSGAINCTIGLGFTLLITCIVSMFLIEKVGRKMLLMASFGGMFFISICLSITMILTQSPYVGDQVSHVSVFFIFLYIIMFALGVATIPWFLTAELCNHFARPMSISIATTANWIIHFIIIMSWLPLVAVAGNFAFLIFIVFDLILVIFVVLTMRETKDLSSIDILELFYD